METQNNFYDAFREAAEQDEMLPVPHADLLWEKVTEKLDEKKQEKRIFIFLRIVAVAASLILLAGGAWWALHDTNEQNQFPVIADRGGDNISPLHKDSNTIAVITANTPDKGTTNEVTHNQYTPEPSSTRSNAKIAANKKRIAATNTAPAPNSIGKNVVSYDLVNKDQAKPVAEHQTEPIAATGFLVDSNSAPANKLSQEYLTYKDPEMTNYSYAQPYRHSFSSKMKVDQNRHEENTAPSSISMNQRSVVIDEMEQPPANLPPPMPQSFTNKPTASFTQMLQGQAAGVSVTATNGAPGAAAYIRLRGSSSTDLGVEPLYVVDGVPVSGKEFNSIAQKDIADVKVLKDASATAVYGSRGANGVVVVNTRKARARFDDGCKNLFQHWFGKHHIQQSGVTEHLSFEEYESYEENQFESPAGHPLSTFSIDVDKASYSNIRRMILNGEQVPKDAVRVEEMINYFPYPYPQPKGDAPFSINTEYGNAPWNPQHRLLKIGLQGREIATGQIPPSNLVFLIDVSGSMEDANKLPLVKHSLRLLTDQLREQDKVAIVVYAGAAGLVLPATNGAKKEEIRAAIDQLEAGGSTAGGEGIELAYKVAKEHFISGGNNRIILATDGDFNIGASSDADMQRLIEQKRKDNIYLTCLGFGMGNYKDSKMEVMADKGNGNYAYIDNNTEAGKVLVKEFGGTMYAIAKDVKIQIEFNPKYVQAYRLIGYENRKLRDEDFSNDTIDAGELGSGHSVTALYEIIPTGVNSAYVRPGSKLRYSAVDQEAAESFPDELAQIQFRYKMPEETSSQLIEQTIGKQSAHKVSKDFRLASGVAWFGLMLRDSGLVPDKDKQHIMEWIRGGTDTNSSGTEKELLQLIEKSK